MAAKCYGQKWTKTAKKAKLVTTKGQESAISVKKNRGPCLKGGAREGQVVTTTEVFLKGRVWIGQPVTSL